MIDSSYFSGRDLLRDSLSFSPDSPHLTFHPGITFTHQKPRCERCGNQQVHLFASFPCSRCQKECLYCRNCIMMGRVAECSELVRWTGPIPDHPVSAGELHWKGQLSDGQQAASDAVVLAIESQNELLVWAVCGAGKTEVLFHGIAAALKANQRVCLATPRTDVVLELAPRLQEVFPHLEVAALYGGSPDRDKYSPLVITTTHQLFRYHQAFDVMVVDEVDAFPYTLDPTLHYAVKKSRKPSSALIYLTATPSLEWQEECQSGKRNVVTIPARFHRHPLPVPEMQWIGRWKKAIDKGKLPAVLEKWVSERLAIKKPVLVFFPHIETMEKALPIFQTLDPRIQSVHSEDPDRKEKVNQMRKQEMPLLLTTTILERGVTITNVDVAVVGAEDDTFTESALVQISGRAGRKADFPDGNITFFHFGRTNAMLQAISHIERMNKQGRERRLIDG
ncbi:competence protein ComFA [Bacillus ectoiniformans]|nr:DEAD/DEAH box helicase [Bacillus ectoiniformans]MBM7649354.1 competence protein ComFA [Bacillus ectoiniformans]